jgi:hypothetical protein
MPKTKVIPAGAKPKREKPAGSGRKPAGKEPRERFSMLLNAEEREMIRALGDHYGVDGAGATLRQAVLREYRRLLAN